MSEKKSYPIIMQDFSIAGIKKQYAWQQYNAGNGDGEFYTINGFDVIGCKTETRRLTGLKEINKNPDEWELTNLGNMPVDMKNDYAYVQAIFYNKKEGYRWIKSPCGVPGDEIWVREACANLNEDFPEQNPCWVYKADLTHEYEHGVVTWRSPMLMPKIASRITLINEGITVERVQDLTEEGALREGIESDPKGGYKSYEKILTGRYKGENHPHAIVPNKSAVTSYMELWQSLHGEESWNANPFVWKLSFSVKELKQ